MNTLEIKKIKIIINVTEVKDVFLFNGVGTNREKKKTFLEVQIIIILYYQIIIIIIHSRSNYTFFVPVTDRGDRLF